MLGDGEGVIGFPTAGNLGERFTGLAGPEGPLDADVAAYIQGLINHAHERHRKPVLACTRLLGRVSGLKAAFNGYHILLIRNLFHQWNSYAGQARFGNWYFLQTLYETLSLAERDPVIAELTRSFPNSTLSSLEAWVVPGNFDRVFCYFVGFHLYFLTLARRSADLVVNANALAAPDPHYRHEIVARISSDVGIELDLEDASERVDFPIYPIADHQACTILTDDIASRIKVSCNANADEQAFIDTLLDAAWSEHALFQRQTKAAFEYLAHVQDEAETRCGSRLHEVQQEAERAAQERNDEREALLRELNSVRQALLETECKWASQIADLKDSLVERETALVAVQADLAREQKAGAQRLNANAAQLEAAAEELDANRRAMAQVKATLASVQDELASERTHSIDREQQTAAALGQIERLQAALAKALEDQATLRKHIDQLGRSIANVDAANATLRGQLLHAQRAGQIMEGNLATEQAKRKLLSDRLERILNGPEGPQRLHEVLNLLMTRRDSHFLLPKAVRYEKLRKGLGEVRGWEQVLEGLDCHPPHDRLAQTLWIALLHGS